MKQLFKGLAWLVGLVVVVLVAAVVLVPMLVDPADYKAEIAAAAKEHTGRDLSIEGDLSMTVFPWLGVKVGKVSLGNARGFADVPFAATERVEIRVEVKPLLFERRLVMDTVTVHGLMVNLERNAKGQANWEGLSGKGAAQTGSSSGRDAGGLALAGVSLGGLDLRDASFSMKDAAAGQDIRVSGINLRTGPLTPGHAVEVEADLKLALSKPAISGTLAVAAVVTADAAGKLINLSGLRVTTDLEGASLPGTRLEAALSADVAVDTASGSAKVAGLVLDAVGLSLKGDLVASGLNAEPSVKGQLEVAQFDLRSVLNSLGIEPPVTADEAVLKAVSATAGLSVSARAGELSPLVVRLDDTTIKGTAGVADLAAMAIRFDLNADRIDVDRYLPPAAQGEGRPAATPGAAATQLPLEAVRGLDVVGRLAVGELRLSKLTMREVAAAMSAQGGVAKLSPVSARLYEGTYKGNVVVDARKETARLSVDETLGGVKVAPLLTDLRGDAPISGTATVSLKATAAGNDIEALKKSLDGAGRFEFADGAINGINVAAMIRDAKAKLTGGSAGADAPQRTDFSVMGGSFGITDGLVNNPDFAAKSPLLRVTGKGTANLVSEAIDYRTTISVVATAKGQGGKELADLAGVDVPLKVGGTFSQPSYGLDEEALIKALASGKLEGVVGDQKAKVEAAVKDKLGAAAGGEASKLLGGVLGGTSGSGEGAESKTDPAAAAGGALKKLFGN